LRSRLPRADAEWMSTVNRSNSSRLKEELVNCEL
jgi:hypothetical protein